MAKVPAIDLGSTDGMLPAAHFDGILEQSRDLICERLDRAVADMLDKATEALSVLIKETRNFEERRLYEEAKGRHVGATRNHGEAVQGELSR